MLPCVFLAILAGLIPVLQAAIVYGTDDFDVTADGRKVFTYGFPFRVYDSQSLAVRTPPVQVPLNLAADFVVWFGAGALILIAARSASAKRPVPQL